MSIYFHHLPIEYLSLANKVVISLEYYRRKMATPEDKDVMLQALSFIKSAIKGELEEKYTLGEEALKASLISTGALRVFISLYKTSEQKPTVTEFHRALVNYGRSILYLTKQEDQEFEGLAKKINSGALTEELNTTEKAINKLKDFFKGLRDFILDQEAVPMEKLTLIQLA